MYVVRIVLVLFWTSLLEMPQPPVVELGERSITRVVDVRKGPERQGSFDFTIASARDAKAYANVVVDLNGDGQIAPYLTDKSELQEEWIVKNVPLPLTSQSGATQQFSILFDFPDKSVPSRAERNSAVIITDHPITGPLGTGTLATWEKFKISILPSPSDSRMQAGQGGAYQRRGTSGSSPVTTNHSPDERSISLIPDIQQRSNECGPTAITNSLLWLSRKYGFESKLPRHTDGSPDTSALLISLMDAMAGNCERPFKGLKGNQMYDGSREYAQKHGLPLEIEGGNKEESARGEHAFQFLASRLDAAAGAQFLVWRPDGEGHWVTVIGHSMEQGRAFLYVHDPDDKKTALVVWELEVDSHGSVSERLVSPSGCVAGWAVVEIPRPQNIARTP